MKKNTIKPKVEEQQGSLTAKKPSFRPLVLFLVAILFIVFAFWYVNTYIYKNRAASGPDAVTFVYGTPNGSFPINQNATTTFTITPNTTTNHLSGFDMTFAATGNLQFVSAVVTSTNVPNFGQCLYNTVSTDKKQLRLACVSVASTAASLPQDAIVTLTFQGTAAGVGGISILTTGAPYGVVGTVTSNSFQTDVTPPSASYTFTSGGTTGPTDTLAPTATVAPGQPTSTPVPSVTTQPGITSTTAPSPSITSGPGGSIAMTLKLKFQGILGKPKTTVAWPVQVKIFNGTTAYTQVGQFNADDQGVWTGTVNFNAPPGYYWVFVKGPKHLQKKFCVANPTETAAGTYRCGTTLTGINLAATNTLDFSKVLLLAGDLKSAGVQDGVIDSYDTSLVINNLGSNDPAVLDIADLNLDGVIDTQDRSLIIQSLNVKYDEE